MMTTSHLRIGLRQLARNPLSSGVSVMILALGIGAATAVFSLVNATLLRPLPYEGAERLVFVAEINRDAGPLYDVDALEQRVVRETASSRLGARLMGVSVDLDVLSPDEMGYQLSTPAGAGLEWWELLEAVRQVMAELNVIASDIVEYNPIASHRRPDDPRHPAHLLLLLIHGLAGNRLRAG